MIIALLIHHFVFSACIEMDRREFSVTGNDLNGYSPSVRKPRTPMVSVFLPLAIYNYRLAIRTS